MKKFFKYYEEYIGGTLFAIMFIILLAQIFFRQILGSPLVWSEELSRLLFVYIAMFGVTLGVKHKQHVGIDLLSEKFTGKTKIIFDVIKTILTTIALILFIFIGTKIALRKSSLELITLGISTGWLYAALPFGGVIMMIRHIENIFNDLKVFREEREGARCM